MKKTPFNTPVKQFKPPPSSSLKRTLDTLEPSPSPKASYTKSPSSFVTPPSKKRRKPFNTPMAVTPDVIISDSPANDEQKGSVVDGSSSVVSSRVTPPSIMRINPPCWLKLKSSSASQKIKLKDVKNLNCKAQKSNTRNFVQKSVLCMNSKKAKAFQFTKESASIDMLNLIQEASGTTVTSIGTNEMRDVLIHLGASKTVVSEAWVANHYRWIVWKLASYERYFAETYSNRMLTPERVLSQLVHRYDVEYCKGRSSCIRRITQRDDSDSRYMVLCVASIDESSNENSVNKKIEITDGWYSLPALLDEPLSLLVSKGKIYEGMKLKIVNAKLQGPEQGCPPLEITPSYYYTMTANCVRRARWDIPLGIKYKLPFLVNVNSLIVGGGTISRIEVIVLRRYPLIFLENVGDQENKVFIKRSQRAEDKVAAETSARKEKKFQQLIEKYSKEQEEDNNENFDIIRKRHSGPIKKVFDGSKLFAMLMGSTDPGQFLQLLSKRQAEIVTKYQQQFLDSQRSELLSMIDKEMQQDTTLSRTVSSFCTVKLRDTCPYKKRDIPLSSRDCTLTIWNPVSEMLDAFSEGNILRIFSATVGKFNYGNKCISLSSGRSMKLEILKRAKDVTQEQSKCFNFQPRRSIKSSQFDMLDLYEEIDLTGIIILIDRVETIGDYSNKPEYHSHVYVADETCEKIARITLKESQDKVIDWNFLKEMKCFFFSNIILKYRDEQNQIYHFDANEMSVASDKAFYKDMKERREDIEASMSIGDTHFQRLKFKIESLVGV